MDMDNISYEVNSTEEGSLVASSISKKSARQCTSSVWNYFDKLKGLNKAKCRVCYAVLSTGSGKTNSTSALRNHLHFKHTTIYKEMVKSEPKKKFYQTLINNIQNAEANLDHSIAEVVVLDSEPLNDSFHTYALPMEAQNGDVTNQTDSIETNIKGPRNRARGSVAWSYFDLSEDFSKAKCRLCSAVLSRGKRKCSTSSLRNHLQYKHSEEYKIMTGRESRIKKLSKPNRVQLKETLEINNQGSEDDEMPDFQLEPSLDAETVDNEEYTIASISSDHISEETSPTQSKILTVHLPLGSAVWRYFDQSEDKSKAVCRLCNVVLSQGSRLKGTTSSLRNHLKFRHAGEYKTMIKSEGKNTLQSLKKKNYPPQRFLKVFHNSGKVIGSRMQMLKAKNNLMNQNSMEHHVEAESIHYTSAVWNYFVKLVDDPSKAHCKLCGASLSTASTLSLRDHLKFKHTLVYNAMLDLENNTPSKQLLNIEKSAHSKFSPSIDLWDISDSRSVQLHNVIAEMIMLDNQNLSIVENFGFRRVLEVAQPHYKIPDQTYFLEKIVPDMCARLKQRMQTKISSATSVSLSCATSTITDSNFVLVKFIGHWISPDIDLCQCILTVKSVPQMNNERLDISKITQDLINEWNLNEKVHLFVKNDTSCVVNEINEEFKSITCFLQSLQSVIKFAIEVHSAVNGMIARARDLIDYFNKSQAASQRLSEFQNDLSLSEVKLALDDDNKWISTFYMLQSVHNIKKALVCYCSATIKTNTLSNDDWSVIESTLLVLQPFAELVKQITNSKSLASEIIPAVTTLQRFLTKEREGHLSVLAFKETIYNRLTEEFHHIDMDDNLCFATCVDPRFKLAFFRKDMQTHFKEMLFEKISNSPQFSLSVNSSQNEQNYSQANKVMEKNRTSFWECFVEVAQENSIDENSINSKEHLMQLLNSEMNMFFSTPLLDCDKNPLDWWRANRNTFPNLVKCAFKYLCAPSSVYCERNISELVMYEKNCTNMNPESSEHLMFLHQNLQFISDN